MQRPVPSVAEEGIGALSGSAHTPHPSLFVILLLCDLVCDRHFVIFVFALSATRRPAKNVSIIVPKLSVS